MNLMMPSTFTFFSMAPNPCGVRVFAAEAALIDAGTALTGGGKIADELRVAGRALREAGWQPAARFVDTLLFVSPVVSGDVMPAAPGSDTASLRALFNDALQAFCAALTRGNLRELACSFTLFSWQRALYDALAAYAPGLALSFGDVALSGRIVLPSLLQAPSMQAFAGLRARYEAALLSMLRAPAQVDEACDELNACLAVLAMASAHPYSFWRLAAACGRALHRDTQNDATLEALRRQFYAHCNLALAGCAQGQPLAPQPLVRETLALLWRDVTLARAMKQHVEGMDVDILSDHGLTVESPAMSDALSGAVHLPEPGKVDALPAEDVKRCALGALSVNANAHENFLSVADEAMQALLDVQHAQAGTAQGDAFRAAEAACRLGAAALTLGLGHISLLAESLGLAWRLTAHARMASNPAHITAPDAGALEQASNTLQAMLLKVAAGVAQPDATGAMAMLGDAIDRATRQVAVAA